MSWIVERLLIEKYTIKSEQSLESDTFNKLLFLEKKIKELRESGFLSALEMEVITLMSEGYSVTEASKLLNYSRETVSNIFRNACNRISFHLGGSYTDQGFLEELQRDYKLSNQEIQKVRDKINSKYRHAIKYNRSDL